MKDNSKLIAIVVVIITIIVVLVSYFFTNKDKNNEEKIGIVTNYSNFYTVNSCLYRVITYASSKDTDSLYLILSDKYKKNNDVTKENILDLFSNIDEDSTFISEKMYYSQIEEDLIKYYVEGRIEKNEIYDDIITNNLNYNKIYFIVYLDSKNKIFSIEPYDGKVFIEGDNYEK